MPKTKIKVYLIADSGSRDGVTWIRPYMAFSNVQDAIACSVKHGNRKRSTQDDYKYPVVTPVDLLIDEPTCENTYDEMAYGSCNNGFKCSVCDEIVEDYEGYCVTGTWNFCPKCGRKVVKHGL